MVLLGCSGMIILAVSIILFVVVYQKKILEQQNQIQATENKHQLELLNASLEVAELEREKIAKNIHDDIGTLLNVIKLHLTKISRNPNDKIHSEELIRESMSMLDESIENIRGIAKELMPPTLIKLGFEKGISELFRQINSLGEIKIQHTFEFSEERLPNKTELQLYRIVHEVINNIIKHSKATQVDVSCKSDSNGIQIIISHNGAGITSEIVSKLAEEQQGIGLKSIQSRVQLIGASIQFLIIGDGNAKILIDIPFHP
jgi:signal transduction histidine kinase